MTSSKKERVNDLSKKGVSATTYSIIRQCRSRLEDHSYEIEHGLTLEHADLLMGVLSKWGSTRCSRCREHSVYYRCALDGDNVDEHEGAH